MQPTCRDAKNSRGQVVIIVANFCREANISRGPVAINAANMYRVKQV